MTVLKEEAFVTRFRSLTGTTIAERRKNLFLLLEETQQSLNNQTLTFDLSTLQPSTPLEEIFKVEILLYFKKLPELLDILKSENPVLIHKILNSNSTLLTQIFDVNGTELVLECFPKFSYITKLKVLNKLVGNIKDTEKIDEFFYSIKDTYGLYLASKLLPGCSSTLIMEYLDLYNIEITPKQLLLIIKRCPVLTEDIFEKLHKNNKEVNIAEKYKYVFMYLMRHDENVFLKLIDKYDPSWCIGSRLTCKFIKSFRDDVIKNSKKYYKLLKIKKVYSYVKRNFEQFLCNLFPSTIKQLEQNFSDYKSIIDVLPSDKDKWRLLKIVFKKVYDCEILDHPICMTQDIMEMMSIDDRENLMKAHTRPEEISEEMWTAFMKIDVSLPLLKQKISFTSNVRDREKLIKSLVLTCKFNRDENALAEVFQYVVNKHRNDNVKVQQEYISVIYDSYNLRKFKLIHWKPLIEYIHLIIYTNEYFWNVSNFVDAYIHFCLDSNMPVEDGLKLWLEASHYNFNVCKSTPKYEKKCLEMFYEIISLKYKDDLSAYDYGSYLQCIQSWNKNNPKDIICFPKYKEGIKKLVEHNLQTSQNNPYPYAEIAVNYIISNFTQLENLNFLEALIKLNIVENCYIKLIHWMVKNQPILFIQNIESLIESLLKFWHIPSHQLITLFKYYSHLNIPQKIKGICSQTINNSENSCEKKHNAVVILSYIMEPKEFIDFVSSYYPLDLIINPENVELKNLHKLQQSICFSLRKLIPPCYAIEPVLNFCKGDYLKFIQKTLYAVSENVAEHRFNLIFDNLITRAVSVRKHGIFLALKTLDKTKVFNILENIMNTEKNLSIRKSIFKSAFNLFLRNPDNYTWDLVKANIKAVDVHDKEAFSKLSQSKKISPRFHLQYIVFVWETLDSLLIADKIEAEKCQILKLIDENNILSLPDKFCIKIIEKYLFKSKQLTELQKEIHDLTCKYLLYCSSKTEQLQHIKQVFSIMENHISLGIEVLTFSFVQTFCSNFIEKQTLDEGVLCLFMESWNSLLEPHDAFNEYLYLKFTLIFLECRKDKKRLSLIAKKIVSLCEYLENIQSLDIFIFSQTLNLFKTNFILDDDNELTLLEAIVKDSKNPICSILVLYLLPKEPYDKLIYNSIIEIIKKQPTKLVKIHLHHYLIQKECPFTIDSSD